jgi:hypothetical protein
MRKVLVVVALLLLSGCAWGTGKPGSLIQVGTASEVKGCRLLESFTGPTSYRMWGTPYTGDFTSKAMEKAEKIGATHTLSVMEDSSLGYTAVLRAYKCPPDHDLIMQNAEEE